MTHCLPRRILCNHLRSVSGALAGTFESNFTGARPTDRVEIAARHLCDELLLGADPIEFAVDHYELANTRLIDHKHASVELFLTGLIVVALVVQTAIILVQELLK